jgi:hypothetical protein
MVNNRLYKVSSTRKVKLTLKSTIIYEPASCRLREKTPPVTIIRTMIAAQSGKDDDTQQQIWTYCTSCIVLWLIIDKVDSGVFLFCRVSAIVRWL